MKLFRSVPKNFKAIDISSDERLKVTIDLLKDADCKIKLDKKKLLFRINNSNKVAYRGKVWSS